ncbi:armadillo repeat domain-containing protein, partial [Amniculicola lignicola CBS 123094]
MVGSSLLVAIEELFHPGTPEEQVAALRTLKNEVVGHNQRKEQAIKYGIVQPLVRILRVEARRGGKRRRGTMNGNGATGARRESVAQPDWSTEDELRFQATLVVGSLFTGGPALVAPMLAGSILPSLLEGLSPAETHSKIIVATLRALVDLAIAVSLEKPWADSSDGPLKSSLSRAVAEQLYSREVIASLTEIVAQPCQARVIQDQVALTTKLVAKTCFEEGQRKLLVDMGVLDLLATKVAAMASADARSLGLESRNQSQDEMPRHHLPDMLESVSAIVRDSCYNTSRFLYSPSILQLFIAAKESNPTTYDPYTAPMTPSTWEKLVPRLQTLQSKSDPYSKAYPVLGAHAGTSDSYSRLPSGDAMQPTSRSVVTEEYETPLFIWLLSVARQTDDRERLSASWLLALLKKFGEKWPFNDPSKTTRDRHFSVLIVPLIVKLIQDANPAGETRKSAIHETPTEKENSRFVLERSLLVLAELLVGNKTLQNAAVDAKVFPALVQILRKSFDPINVTTRPMWAPRRSPNEIIGWTVDPVSSTPGKAGLSAEVLHAFRYRENALLALAAIADTQDPYRKLVIEHGAAPHIIEALVPYAEQANATTPTQANSSMTSKDGNPASVLIAACKVTRSLSRSISVLRTSLMDNGFAQPSYELLIHPNINVQIAATEVITNLVLEVSPVRTEIVNAGVLKVLCEHCRSANFDLRYDSLWALKHLCLGLSRLDKRRCLDELGVGWLVQTLSGELASRSSVPPLSMGTPNAAGERVDLLNAVDQNPMDVDDQDSSSEEDEDTMTDSIPSMRRHQRGSMRFTSAPNFRDRIQTIKDDEQNQRINNERDDIRIQEQALDFIRNIVNDDKNSGELIDLVLESFNHSRLFEILDSKIRPKGLSSATASQTPSFGFGAPSQRSPFPSNAPSNINWAHYPPTELIVSTLYILVHLANGRPQHRSLLISQSTLMSHILPLLSHPRREVRLPCSWFVNNLVWVEDTNDFVASRERAMCLRNMGFEDRCRTMSREDLDLDVQQRAKTAVEQFHKLLDERSGYVSPGPGGFGSGLGGLQ